MAEVVWRVQALHDLDDIIDYIERFDPAAAERYHARFWSLGESLSDFPRRGRAADDGTREMTSVPPFILRYDVEDDRVFILSIRHGARRPV